MAIAFDAASNGAAIPAGSPLTIAHTVGSGSNRILVVGVSESNHTGSPISGVTYNGVSMTEGPAGYNWVTTVYLRVYYLYAPDTGTHDIVISWTGTDSTYFRAAAASYSGVLQSGFPDSTVNNKDLTTQTSLAATTTTVADNCWVVGISDTFTTVSSVTNGTIRSASSDGEATIFDTNGVVTPAGNKTLTINFPSDAFQAMRLFSIAPASAAVATSIYYRPLMGVGN